MKWNPLIEEFVAKTKHGTSIHYISTIPSPPVKFSLDEFIRVVAAFADRVWFFDGKLVCVCGHEDTLVHNNQIFYLTISTILYSDVDEYKRYIIYDLQTNIGLYTNDFSKSTGQSKVIPVIPRTRETFEEIFLEAIQQVEKV